MLEGIYRVVVEDRSSPIACPDRSCSTCNANTELGADCPRRSKRKDGPDRFAGGFVRIAAVVGRQKSISIFGRAEVVRVRGLQAPCLASQPFPCLCLAAIILLIGKAGKRFFTSCVYKQVH